MLVQLGNPIRRLITFALVAMMVSASLLSPALASAQAQSIQSSLTGVTISYGPPYELMDDGVYADDMLESMIFLGSADMLAMGFMTPLIDLNGARDIMLEELFGETGTAATIDRGDYTGVSYSLDMLNIDGMEMGVFSLFMNQRSHGFSEFYIFLAPPTMFASAMQTAQSTFTINGSPLMDGVDATVMGNMVTANIGITGGTAVTDVTDVAQTTDTTTETTETDTSQTTSDPGSDEADNLSYALLVMAEYSTVDAAIGEIFSLLQDLDQGVSDAQTVRPLIDEQYAILAGTNDRVAALEVPSGMKSFHQETLEWANAVTLAGMKWFDFVEGRTDSADATDAMMTALDVHIAFGESLQAVNLSSGTSVEAGTTEVETGTEQTDAVDANTYLTIVQDHRGEFFLSFLAFDELLSRMANNPTDAEISEIRSGSLEEAEYWTTFSSDAAAMTPPPGYETVHQEYLAWAAEVTELGNLWIGAMNQDGTTIDQFYDQLDVVLAADDRLEAAIHASGDTQTTETTEATESTSTSSRTTRSTGASGTEESTSTTETGETSSRSTRSGSTTATSEGTETSSRTSRTARTGTSTETPETTETTSRTSRTTRSGENQSSGNTSETSGRVGQNTIAANSWLMNETGVTFTWSDDFALNDSVDEPQFSDASAGEDKISLQTTTSDGSTVRFSVTVYPNSLDDSTGMINGLVNDQEALIDLFGEAEIIDYELTSDESAALIWAVDEIGVYWVYTQVTCVTPACDTVAFVLVVAEGDALVETLSAMENGVAIDGQSISTAIPVGDVENAVEQFGE